VSGHHHLGGIGDGVLIAQKCDIGNAVLVWDGREQVDLNMFTFHETEGDPEISVTTFMYLASGGMRWKLASVVTYHVVSDEW
jgi:hypothetical protein